VLSIDSLSFISIYFNGFCNFIYTRGSSPQHVFQLKQHLLTLDYLAYGSVNRLASLAAVSCIYDKVVENKRPTSKLSSPSTVKGHKAGTAAQTDTRTNDFAGVTQSLLVALFFHMLLSLEMSYMRSVLIFIQTERAFRRNPA